MLVNLTLQNCIKTMTVVDYHDWILNLRQNGLQAIETLYQEWRNDFVAFAQRYGAPEEDILDAYQDAVVVLYENILNGKLQQFSSTPKTYLFSIGKYKLLNKLKAKNKLVGLSANESEGAEEWTYPEQDLNQRQQRMYQALKQLGASCQQLIQLFYYQKLSIREIVVKAGFKNENTVKAQKSRCIKSLRERLQKA